MKLRRLLCCGSALAFLAGAGGCKDKTEIQVYRAPKDAAPSSLTTAEAPAPIRWTVPAGWRIVPPSSMRYASFTADGAGGEAADISVSMLPGEGGDDLGNVNRWRAQIGLVEVGAAELDSLVVPRKVPGADLLTVDMTGPKSRVLAAWTRVGGRTWFFKLTAPEGLVDAEKSRFQDFLESVQFNP